MISNNINVDHVNRDKLLLLTIPIAITFSVEQVIDYFNLSRQEKAKM